MNKQEALDFISEYFSQDNYGTAYPIYFVILDGELEHDPESDLETAEKYSIVSKGWNNIGMFNTVEEALKSLQIEYEVPEVLLNEDHEDYWDFDCIFQQFLEDNMLQCYPMKTVYTYKQMFLLESEAQAHLEENAHHYSKDARVYCMHAWRCDRQKDFLESIKKILEEK